MNKLIKSSLLPEMLIFIVPCLLDNYFPNDRHCIRKYTKYNEKFFNFFLENTSNYIIYHFIIVSYLKYYDINHISMSHSFPQKTSGCITMRFVRFKNLVMSERLCPSIFFCLCIIPALADF